MQTTSHWNISVPWLSNTVSKQSDCRFKKQTWEVPQPAVQKVFAEGNRPKPLFRCKNRENAESFVIHKIQKASLVGMVSAIQFP